MLEFRSLPTEINGTAGKAETRESFHPNEKAIATHPVRLNKAIRTIDILTPIISWIWVGSFATLEVSVPEEFSSASKNSIGFLVILSKYLPPTLAY